MLRGQISFEHGEQVKLACEQAHAGAQARAAKPGAPNQAANPRAEKVSLP